MVQCCKFDLVHKVRAAFARQRVIAETTRELAQSSDRALNEMGLSRGDIAEVAVGSYRRP